MTLVMVGAYRHPGSETPLTWQAFILAGLLDLPALGSHAARLLYAYPAFFVVMGSGVLIATALGARVAGRPAQRQRYLPRDREAAPPAPRPACPAGQWEIFRGPPQPLPHPSWRAGLLEGGLHDRRRGADETGDRIVRGEHGQVGQDEESFRADHRGQVPLELGEARRIRGR
jgi:hypothetical protein